MAIVSFFLVSPGGAAVPSHEAGRATLSGQERLRGASRSRSHCLLVPLPHPPGDHRWFSVKTLLLTSWVHAPRTVAPTPLLGDFLNRSTAAPLDFACLLEMCVTCRHELFQTGVGFFLGGGQRRIVK